MKRISGIFILLLILLGTIASNTAASTVFHVPVLMYHMIEHMPKGEDYPDLWVEPEVFDKTMHKLKANGWKTILPKEISHRLSHGLSIPRKTFAIIIDDGHSNGYDFAYPILEKYGFKAAFAVVVKRIGHRPGGMSWDELKDLEAHGHEIADHTWSHADLPYTSASSLVYQVEHSADILEQNLGTRPSTFVYPFGHYSSAVVAQVRASGFKSAYTTVYGAREASSNRFLMPRIRVHRYESPSAVLSSISPYS